MEDPTTEGLAAHMAAELAEQFARRHAAHGCHELARQNYLEAAHLYAGCGCVAFGVVAVEKARHEGQLAALYGVRI